MFRFSGSKASVDIAEYVSAFLDNEMEILWNKAKTEKKLKGLRAKNSFFRGIVDGYMKKFEQMNKAISKEENRSLQKYNQELILKAQALIYQSRLKTKHSRYKNDAKAIKAGNEAGYNLQIKQGIQKGDQAGKHLLE